MPEKGAMSWPSSSKQSPLLQWRLALLTALVLVGMVLIWSMDATTMKNLVEATKSQQGYFTTKVSTFANNLAQNHENVEVSTAPSVVNQTQKETNSTQLKPEIDSQNPVNDSTAPIVVNQTQKETNLAQKETNLTQLKPESDSQNPVNDTQYETLSDQNSTGVSVIPAMLNWVSANLEPDVTKSLLAKWLAPGGEPCRDARTVGIAIPGLDGKDLVELSAGEIYEFGFQALDENKKPRCLGGDYFETDLSGESWKSRPVVKDFGNGSYSLSLQVHPDFVGSYNLTIILLFRHFEGLKFSPNRFAYDREIRRIPIRFNKGSAQLPELQVCKESDFGRDVWAGRWTRHGKNDKCEISQDGRYRCLSPSFPCQSPWCNGSLGSLESNGWVYSTHCSFRLFSADSAWNCLNNRWLFFWGDSNHVDSIRNILNFILDMPEVLSVPRRFDMHFTNPKDPSQKVRITSLFNGHWNETQNYQGLNSLKDEGFRNLIKKYFSEEKVPDTIIMNSGLHDGVFWSNIRSFSAGASYAASFWVEIMDSIRQRGLVVPKVFYRTTIATGGYARTLAFNPNKMETFNWILVEKLKQAGILTGVIDNFDMTFPWHFDNRCNDGVHYGRAPAKAKWRDGLIGHHYFVDLMLDHIVLNVLCPTR
ncbi:uncharacterized protein LOC133709491 [Rosa rugosa]|uniref:uncharacterized protein LOC133709491 n=1 Tax=Rosa rugosa TaxID=74645 RepID=UPI002B40B615|nr:uncharacterized protein LOC133709491 [Rosa rugosa]XP_061991245.1 uncharacterized protein LOC133709491 [Rosa rugosa]